jgi:hypothetical protein
MRWNADSCTSSLISHTATATLTPSTTPSNTASPSITATGTATRSASPSASPASFCNVRVIAGTGTASSTGDGGQSTSATTNSPFGVATDGTWLYVGEYNGQRVRRVNLATGIITTYAGTGSGTGSFLGVAATSANLGVVASVVILPNGDVATGAQDRCTLVGIAAGTQVTYGLAGNGTCLAAGNAASSGVAANATAFGLIRYMAVWGDGVFVSSWPDHRVRLVNLTTGACMGGGGGGGGGGSIVVAHVCAGGGWQGRRFAWPPRRAACPPWGVLRTATPPPLSSLAGLVETWANTAGTASDTGDGGAATAATLDRPEGLLVYNGDTLLVACQSAHVIRAINLNTRVITRWAGTGTASSTGDGLDKLAATFNFPHGLAVLPDNSLLIVQNGGCRIARVTAAGVVRLFAGTGTCSSTGNGGSALSATLFGPVGVAVDNSTGTVYWGEIDGNRVRDRGGGRWRGCTLWQRPQTAMRARPMALRIVTQCASSPSQHHKA